MNYLALYRKYRPTDLDEVVGQAEVKKILATSILNNTITHAYLFSGPRGTGKTTMAKILAKMVNCENPVSGNPCGICNSCLNIMNSSDIIEIDAASNNGVDEIRDLREKANLVPSMCKYKVYIIDEVHMLTTQAFNALLKTLEEPPKHVIFILATTEYHKIPLTITSRCQKFKFSKLDNNLIVDRLKKIAVSEDIKITDEALEEIAKISDGGMRDSINLLDQLRSFDTKEITIQDVTNVCGSILIKDIVDLLFSVKDGKYEKIISFFDQMNSDGKNYSNFFIDVMNFLNDVILYKNGVSLDLIKTNESFLTLVSEKYSDADVIYLINSLNNLVDKFRFVSRQNVVIISNFLLFVSYFSNKDNSDKILVNKEEKKELAKYESNYDDMSNNKLDDMSNLSKKNENVLSVLKKERVIPNKDILINNAFAVANKDIKRDLQVKFSHLDEYLTNKKFTSVVGLFMDLNMEVAGDNYIIFSAKYDALIDSVYDNYQLCCEFIKYLFSKEYYFVVVSISSWEKYKKEYISNVKNSVKYNIMELNENLTIEECNSLNNDKPVVSKLFDLVGEDTIEFK